MSWNKFLNFQLTKSSFSKISLFATSFTISQGIMMVYSIILARYLGPEGYGYYATGYSLVGLWSFFISIGMDTWFLQRSRNKQETRALSGEIIKAKMLIFLIWAPVLVIGLTQVKSITIEFLIICIFDVWGDSLFITLIYGLNIQQNYQKVAGILMVSRLGRLISVFFLMGLGVRDPALFALFRLFFTIIGFFSALIAMKPEIKIKQVEITKIPFRELTPFWLSEMLAQIYIMADVSLISVLAGKVQVGLYSPATNVLSALFIIPNSLYLYILPKFSKKFAVNNKIPEKEINISLIGFGLVGLFLFLGIVLSAEWIIPLVLGSAFIQTTQLLLKLSPIVFLKSLQFGFIAIIVSSKLQKYRLIPQLIAAIINVGLNFILIPKLGAEGAVLAYNLSELTLLVGYGTIVLVYKTK